MNLCIDQGNSSTKIGIFNTNDLVDILTFAVFSTKEINTIFEKYAISSCIISSVVLHNEEIISLLKEKSNYFLNLNHTTPLPIINQYKTPETLGKDRLAAIIGANFLRPNTDILVIDVGTAITFDFISSTNIYKGGNISPGIDMRLRALHEFTKKLPLVKARKESPLLGNNTEEALTSGVLHGIVFELDGYIEALKIKYPQLCIFLTGGSIFYFDTKLKNAIFAERNLVLIGLNRIQQYNVQK